jgi:hypothetical protein
VEPRRPLLAPTPPERLLDQQGRPYFLWDCDVDVEGLRQRLSNPDPVVRGYWLGKLMRQAKPDDVFTFVTWEAILQDWDRLFQHLGKRRPLWLSLKEHWREHATQ